jgi:hypothetical protein
MYLLDELAKSGSPLFFVQIGSNDGVSGDPLHAYIKRFGWQGVLVEPLLHLYRELMHAYAGIPGIRFENAAIAERSGARAFYYLRDTSDPMPRPGTGRSVPSIGITS